MVPFLLVPGLNCDARVYSHAATALWPLGPVTVANHLAGEGVAAIARNILGEAPPRFALAGFSMGGYISLEIMRQAPGRVLKLALLDTNARPDSAELTENRRRRIALTRGGKFGLVVEQSFAASVHSDHVDDSDLYAIHRTMADANGPEVYVRHQKAIIARPDSRPGLGAIEVPTLIVVGEGDEITPPDMAEEMHGLIAGSTLVTIPRAGHMALLEQPDLMNAALRQWAAA